MGTDGKHSALKRVTLREQIPVRINNTPWVAGASSERKSASARLAGSAMFSPQAWEGIARRLKLSGRELQIVRGVFDDQKELTIAKALDVSAHTIHTHVRRLHRKLAIADREQLLLRVMQEYIALTATPESGLPRIYTDRTTTRASLRPKNYRLPFSASPC